MLAIPGISMSINLHTLTDILGIMNLVVTLYICILLRLSHKALGLLKVPRLHKL